MPPKDVLEHAGLPLWRRLCPVAALLLLSPYCAEFLVGYQGGYVTQPAGLLIGVLVAAPLYGSVAVLIREVARRFNRGWATILSLSAAFGVVQAGLIDQGLFNHGWLRDSPYWEDLRTVIPGLNVDVHQFLVFVVGHMIWSFAAPIAVVEAAFPSQARRPWLGPVGLGVMVILYLGAAAVFHNDLVVQQQFRASDLQLGAAIVLTAILILAAFTLRPQRPGSAKQAPRPTLVGIVVFALLAGYMSAFEFVGAAPWPAVSSAMLELGLLGWLLWRWSGQVGWSLTHVLAIASAPLILYALMAFAVPPVGGFPTAMKYLSNAIVLLCLCGGVAWLWRRARSLDRQHVAAG
jgi:hypothetical protein